MRVWMRSVGVALALSLPAASCTDGSESPAYRLAIADEGESVEPDEARVEDYERLLKELTRSTCSIPEGEVADQALAAHEEVDGDILTILEGVAKMGDEYSPAELRSVYFLGGDPDDPVERCAMYFKAFIAENT